LKSASTIFIGGEHNTTTDEILFDSEVPDSHKNNCKVEIKFIKHTNGNSRKAGNCHNSVVLANKKSNNWGETRPEWGLKNAGFIVCREN
jgi:uncharacterized protein YbcC (UPF0753/DUF2309 family)